MHTNYDLRPLHRLAVTVSVDIVADVTRADLASPTPCAGWDLRDLLTHMTVQHNGFAAAARGSGADLAVWDPATVADAVRADPAGAYAAAAADVLEAFSAGGVPDATFALPEFGQDAAIPAWMAIAFHFVDYVMHGWDVARSVGVPFVLPAEVIEAVVPLALAVPDGDIREVDNSPFAHAVTGEEGASDLDRVLRHLGRSPDWRPEGVTVGR
ncbi:TIGR03086 family metal-binding protein [Mycolicibacterium celeriflavum]|uniref:TIGR03086 family protein n=1 Tax=Mycolicibacterium celeriflavum TaxID=1249101 RepID=A0A1X0BNS3_MYCCF|nr:TIGR03086 family metal-binding protein [Mycolicibacterium celeriflavum]MCV7240529.1 TIGR03086 family protein [Mycolicibacterium celeriflavum]ORA44680.1 TIGR03086 family protein [Mycolicibacterium celeriflavum]BBY44651.1 TIGR03086 family protein [Mycolicibacterium celeriflavum]